MYFHFLTYRTMSDEIFGIDESMLDVSSIAEITDRCMDHPLASSTPRAPRSGQSATVESPNRPRAETVSHIRKFNCKEWTYASEKAAKIVRHMKKTQWHEDEMPPMFCVFL